MTPAVHITKKSPRQKDPLRIGLVYDRVEDYPQIAVPSGTSAIDEEPGDRFAEFEPPSTIEAMEQAVIAAGHNPLYIGSPHLLLDNHPEVDLVWNIGEGYGTRNREAWAPSVCEMRGIPFLGSDAYALTVTLDKALSKQIARDLGIPVAPWQIISPDSHSGTIPDPVLPFPQFLKPRYEGTAKGITEKSVVYSVDEFCRQSRYLMQTYRQDVMAEPFLSGPELTCAMAYHPLHALPVMERGLHSSGIGAHALENKMPDDTGAEPRVSGIITPHLEEMISTWSGRFCRALGIHDFARLDFKMTRDGDPVFLEINPLPTFGVDSTFAILAEMQGISYPEFLAGIISDAIRRLQM